MKNVLKNQYNDEFLSRHLSLMQSICYISALLFLFWGVLVSLFENARFEIWPIRISISLLFVALGFFSKKFKFSLRKLEWYLSILSSLAVSYAFYISWSLGLHPTWIAGSLLIIIGALNFLTYRGPTAFLVLISFLMSLTSFKDSNVQMLMNPFSVFLNFFTAIVLGCYSSIQRNRFLLHVLKTESLQNLILNNMSEGVVLHDKTGKIVAINPAVPQILGLSEDQILGKANIDPIFQTFNEDDSVCTPENHPSARAQKTGKPVLNFTMHLKKIDHSWAWLDITAVPIFSNNQIEPDGTIVTLREMTSLKNALTTIEQQKSSLYASSKLSALGEMSAGIAHEINNPLAVIMGLSQMIKRKLKADQLDKAEIEKHADSLISTTNRISKIILSMRALSRQNDTDTFEVIDIETLMNEINEICVEGLKHSQIQISYHVEKNLIASCQKGQMAQVILNLIGNSRDAISNLDQKWIKIEARLNPDNFIELSVTDSGSGIPIHLHEKVLQPFFTTKEVGKGTGLGLSLVRTIILNHKGQISIDSECPNTRFVIKFPQNSNILEREA